MIAWELLVIIGSEDADVAEDGGRSKYRNTDRDLQKKSTLIEDFLMGDSSIIKSVEAWEQ